MSVSEFFSIVFSGMAALGAFYAVIGQVRFNRAQAAATLSQIDSDNIKDALELKKQYKDDMNSLRADLQKEREARTTVETLLEAARITIADLQERDVQREAAMSELKTQFERDSLLRANVEKALTLANEKISSLELSNRSMSERITSLENERRTWRNGIKLLIDQVAKHNEEPAWQPPDTQPLVLKHGVAQT